MLGSLSSGMLLYGASMLYGVTGSTGYGEIAAAVRMENMTENIGLIVGGVGVEEGGSVAVGVEVTVGDRDGVSVKRGVRVGRGVGVSVGVLVGVRLGARTRVGVMSASMG